MAAGDALNGSEEVARYVKNLWVARDPESGIELCDPEAFAPRLIYGEVEREISLNCVGYFGHATSAANLSALKAHLEQLGRNVKRNGSFATATVQQIIDAGHLADAQLDVIEDPLPDDASHAAIIGIQLTATLVHARVAQTMVIHRFANL